MGVSRFGVSGTRFGVWDVRGFRYAVPSMWFRDLVFRVGGSGVQGFGGSRICGTGFSRFGVSGTGFLVLCYGFSKFRVWGMRFRVRGFWFSVKGFRSLGFGV